jgi:hypothetical protein
MTPLADWAHGVKGEKLATPVASAAAPAQQGAVNPGQYQWTPDRGLVLVQ